MLEQCRHVVNDRLWVDVHIVEDFLPPAPTHIIFSSSSNHIHDYYFCSTQSGEEIKKKEQQVDC